MEDKENENVETDVSSATENVKSILKKLYESMVEIIPSDSFLKISPLGFGDSRKMIESGGLEVVGINFKELLDLEAIFELPSDYSKISVVATELLKARGYLDQVDSENTPIAVVEAWTMAVLIQSSRFFESDSLGN